MSAHVTVISTSPVYIATSTSKTEEISHISQLHASTDIPVVKKIPAQQLYASLLQHGTAVLF